VLNEQEDQDTTGQSGGQTENVDRRKNLVSTQVPPRDL